MTWWLWLILIVAFGPAALAAVAVVVTFGWVFWLVLGVRVVRNYRQCVTRAVRNADIARMAMRLAEAESGAVAVAPEPPPAAWLRRRAIRRGPDVRIDAGKRKTGNPWLSEADHRREQAGMHDPMTVAFEIRYPWWHDRPWPKGVKHWEDLTPEQQRGRSRAWPKGYRDSFITIWHVDPERDGTDDSCGWCYPRLTDAQKERLRNAAWSEGQHPYFLRRPGRKWTGTRHEAECLYRGLLLLVSDVLDLPLSFDRAARMAARHVHRPDCTDPADTFCHEPGYHTNFKEDSAEHRWDRFYGILCGVAKGLLRDRRPWWRHPRWHVHHWKFRVRPMADLKRWLFSRCAKCGGRFPWGYAPLSDSWDGTGPQWFRGERGVRHHECSGAASPTIGD